VGEAGGSGVGSGWTAQSDQRKVGTDKLTAFAPPAQRAEVVVLQWYDEYHPDRVSILQSGTVAALQQRVRRRRRAVVGVFSGPDPVDLITDSRDPLFASNFATLLARAARENRGRSAIRFRGNSITFEQLSRRAGGIARALQEAGVTPGDRCAVLIKEPADAAAAFFAVLATGAVGINVNELYRPRQVEYVLKHSGASVFVTSDDSLENQPRGLETRAKIVSVTRIPPGDRELEVTEVAALTEAQVTYTSASTGLPKGVLMSHAALWAGVRIVAKYLDLQANDRIAGLLPFSFVYGFNQLTTALFTGATLVVDRSTLAAEIVETLRREEVTVLAGVPPLWAQLMSVRGFREEPLPKLRIMTCAGGRLPPAAVRELRRAQPQAKLFLMYGLTEVFRSTYLPAEEVDEHPDSMGRAIPESAVYVVREDGTLAAVGEVGELVHGGPTVGLGYLGDPDATQRVFKPNPFLRPGEEGPERVAFSGDLVRRDEGGRLYYVSRRDRMIKTLGFRVSPDEITDVIQQSGEVRDVAIVTEPDPVRGERIVACVVLRDSGTLEKLTRFCKLELPRHMQPQRYVTLEAIPRNASGKHDILTLKQQVVPSAATRASDA
jgi:acyl-CoA synthetase (AMP-forming)/AMP-acid ligase II